MQKLESKIERLEKLINLLCSNSFGLTKSEIARLLGVNRSTASRYIDELYPLYPIQDNGSRYYIEKKYLLNTIKVDIHESLALYLSARLMYKKLNFRYPHAVTAISKISNSFKKTTPYIKDCLDLTASGISSLNENPKPEIIKIIEDITVAWSDRKWVEMKYFSRRRNAYHKYIFSIFAIEPYPDGHSLYVIGKCRGEDKIRPFKIDLISEIKILDKKYELDTGFDISEHFSNAWGIWLGDKKPVNVKLRFDKEVAERVKLTKWHNKQKITDEKVGSILWEAEIAEPRELLPWIRGWGASVEILEPLELRKRMVKEIKKMQETYKI